MLKMYFGYFKALMTSKKGQGMVEYGLLVSLIAVVVIAALLLLGPQIASVFTSITGKLANPGA